MSRNGMAYSDGYRSPETRRFSPAPPDDYRRREYEWNQYVAQGSPPRSIGIDYPRNEMERDRRRPEEDRPRYRDRSPIRDYRHDDDRRHRGSPRRDHQQDYGDYRSRDREYKERTDHRRRPKSRSRTPSPPGVERESVWSRGACPTVVVSRIPPAIDDKHIREEVERFGAPLLGVRTEYESGPNDANDRICIIEFEGTRDAISWMTEHQGCLMIGRDQLSVEYFDPRMGVDRGKERRDRDRSHEQDRSDRRRNSEEDYPRRYYGEPTDTMIVKGLDRDSTEASVRSSFEYITQFPIIDIRLVRDKFGVSRGFCFVQWKGVEECQQVLDYLLAATPRFHIDGKHVALEFSTPQGASRKPRIPQNNQGASSNTLAAVQVAEAAIQAANWSKGVQSKDSDKRNPQQQQPQQQQQRPFQQQQQQQHYPQQQQHQNINNALNNPPAPASAPQPPPQVATLQPGQYPTPDTTKFQYDQTSGYYYDAITGLYYDANSRYFYNNFTNQYLYYDANKKNYVPVSNEAQSKEKEKKDKEQKKINAKKIAKDMERWAKAQNKKKEEIKKIMESTPGSVGIGAGGRKESSTADAAFSLLEKETSEADRQAAVSAAYQEELFKMPVTPSGRKAATQSSNSGLVSYSNASDSEEEDDDDEEKLIDWDKMACLLCRRGFPSKEILNKHKEMSDLHKKNLEERRKSKVGNLTRAKKMNEMEPQIKYRDRAAERRKNFGSTDPPPRKKDSRMQAPVPYEQPTKDGLDDKNIGNQMLQRMGWKEGSGLGKSQSGITAPITVQQRSRNAGLGARGSTYGLAAGDVGDYRTAAKKLTYMRYMETD